jgi:PAS domain S-box-containing protein
MFIIISTVLAGAFVLFSLAMGVTILTTHFLYIPIILVAYRYPGRGIIFAGCVSILYLLSVSLIIGPEAIFMIPAAGRASMFVLIAGVVSHLSERLQTKEAQYRAVLEDQTELICRFRSDGTYLYVNDAFCRYFSKKSSDIVGSRFAPVIPEDDRSVVTAHFSSLTPAHPSYSVEHRIVLPDGTVRWLAWNDRAFFDEDGIPMEYQSVGRDITARKRAEEALRSSEILYRTIFDTTGTGTLIIEEDGTIALANKEIESLYGHSRSEMEGKRSITDYISPKDVDMVWAYHTERLADSGVAPCTFEARFLDGEEAARDTIMTVELIPETRRQVVSISDITRMKQAERLIRVANSINQLIVHERNAQKLLEKSCREFTKIDEYFTISICLFDGKTLIPRVISNYVLASLNASTIRCTEVEDAIRNRSVTVVPVNEDSVSISYAFAVPMIVGEEVRGVLMVYLHPLTALGEQDLDTLVVLGNDLAFALKMIEIEKQKKAALAQIEKNMEQLSILNDLIRNPLQAIVGIADLDGGANAGMILSYANEIDGIVNSLDRGCLESEKIREFLRKHYAIEQN